MAIRLIVNKLADECAGVFESHLALADPLVIHKVALIVVAIPEVMRPPPVSLVSLEIAFVIFPICILK